MSDEMDKSEKEIQSTTEKLMQKGEPIDLSIVKEMVEEYDETKRRNLKSWAVKLPEEVIEEIEMLKDVTGLRFKNEFIEYLIEQHKVNLFKEGKYQEEMLHPEIVKSMSSDIFQLAKLTQNINEMFINQLEKFSLDRYAFERTIREIEAMKKEKKTLKKLLDEAEREIKTMKRDDGEKLNTQFDEILKKSLNKTSGHTVLIGTSGSGKTYMTLKEIKRSVEKGKQVLIIDHQGEYKKITENLDGTYLNLKEITINPFEIIRGSLRTETLEMKIMWLMGLIELLLERELNVKEREIVSLAIKRTYITYGIDHETEIIEGKKMPTLSDLSSHLYKLGHEGLVIADELQPYISGVLDNFNGERNVQCEETPILTIGIHDLDRKLSNPAIYIITEFFTQIMKAKDLGETLFVIDEIYAMTQSRQMIDLLSSLFKEMKKFNVNMWVTTQDAKKFITISDNIILNTENIVLTRQHINDISDVQKLVGLNEWNCNMLQKAKRGQAVLIKNGIEMSIEIEQDGEIDRLSNLFGAILF